MNWKTIRTGRCISSCGRNEVSDVLETEKLKISISKGDTGTITLTFTGEDVPDDTVTALVTLRENVDSPEFIWEKRLPISEGVCTVSLGIDDTNLPYGKYAWDVRLLYETGEIYTPMRPAEFRIVEVVGEPDG